MGTADKTKVESKCVILEKTVASLREKAEAAEKEKTELEKKTAEQEKELAAKVQKVQELEAASKAPKETPVSKKRKREDSVTPAPPGEGEKRAKVDYKKKCREYIERL